MAVEGHSPLMLAHVALLKALNAGKRNPPREPRRKAIKKYKVA
jgi:hypothetical protein